MKIMQISPYNLKQYQQKTTSVNNTAFKGLGTGLCTTPVLSSGRDWFLEEMYQESVKRGTKKFLNLFYSKEKRDSSFFYVIQKI